MSVMARILLQKDLKALQANPVECASSPTLPVEGDVFTWAVEVYGGAGTYYAVGRHFVWIYIEILNFRLQYQESSSTESHCTRIHRA